MNLLIIVYFIISLPVVNTSDFLYGSFDEYLKSKGISTLQDAIKLELQREDLKCSKKCLSPQCCVCNNNQYLDNEGRLNIEYVSDIPILLSIETYSYYSVEFSHGNLTQLPANICEYRRIVKINLSFNYISEIDQISCLTYLDTANFSYNIVEYLSNRTFSQMKFIRKIDLSYNRLKYIEPGFLINMNGSLFNFDVSHNFLTSLDITNILWQQIVFCKADFSFNKIYTVTNEQNWQCQQDSMFSLYGKIDLSFNEFTEFVDFHKIGFSNFYCMGKILLRFIIHGNRMLCDCKLYPLLKAEEFFSVYFGSFLPINMKCQRPMHLGNRNFLDFVKRKELHLLICNISMSQKCPHQCYCFYQPDIDNRTVVNCSSTGLTRMPVALPDNNNLQVDLSNNRIRQLNFNEWSKQNNLSSKPSYLSRIHILDLSNNFIKVVPNRMNDFKHNAFLNLTGNPISQVSRGLQELHPCQISLGRVVIKCRCEDIWMQQWLPNPVQKCFGNTQIVCSNDGVYKSVSHMTMDSLGCLTLDKSIFWLRNIICSVLFLIVLAALLVNKFRYELLILTRNFVKYFKKYHVEDSMIYDVYISCNDADESIRHWLTSSLVPNLENSQLKVFLPYRDCTFGRPREIEIIDAISKSRNFVIILSEKYPCIMRWNEKEWKHAWYNYKHSLCTEIIIINYDMLNCCETAKRYLGAFLRLGKYIDFSNFSKSIEHEIKNRIFNMRPRFKEKGHRMKDYGSISPVHKVQRHVKLDKYNHFVGTSITLYKKK